MMNNDDIQLMNIDNIQFLVNDAQNLLDNV